MSEDTAIKFTNVTKEYILLGNNRQRFKSIFSNHVEMPKVTAVNHVSFEIKKGEAVALIGRNGAGKSSILKLITSVSYPTKGTIEVNGRVSALLELTAGFDPNFTGRENIYLRCQVMGMNKKEIKAVERKIIDFADIGTLIDQPTRTYSTGMRARLGFAINANVMPDILIIDEALSVGDQTFQAKCKKRVRELLEDGSVTLLFVSHSTASAKAFCKRGMVIDKGEIMFDDSIEDAIDFYNKMLADQKKNSK